MKRTLNVGAGGRTFKRYPNDEYECTNVDERELLNIDKVMDVTNLAEFEDAEFDYILASDIIEHFPIAQTKQVLREWLRVLKPEGVIEFRLPNLEAICKQYFSGGKNAKNISWLLYGGQDYSGNFHYVAFDRAYFNKICTEMGLEEVMYKEDGFNMVTSYRRIQNDNTKSSTCDFC